MNRNTEHPNSARQFTSVVMDKNETDVAARQCAPIVLEKKEIDVREIKERAASDLELRILGGAIKQTLGDGSCPEKQCHVVDRVALAKHAHAIAEEAPTCAETVPSSYVLHLQSRLCLALSGLESSQQPSQLSGLRRPGRAEKVQPSPQEITLGRDKNEAGNRDTKATETQELPVPTDIIVASRDIASLRDVLARTKARRDSLLSYARRSSRASLIDISIPDLQEDEEEDTDSVTSEDSMGMHLNLVFAKEALSDRLSFTRSSSRGLITDDDGTTEEDGEDHQMDSMDSASFHIDLTIAREEFGDARSFSRSSRSLPTDLPSSSAVSLFR